MQMQTYALYHGIHRFSHASSAVFIDGFDETVFFVISPFDTMQDTTVTSVDVILMW